MNAMVYLAHPIDQTTADYLLSAMVSDVAVECRKAGLALFRPGCAYTIPRAYTPAHLAAIDGINRAALDRCSALIAVLPPGVPTLGTPVEVERALGAGKPVAIVTTARMRAESVQVQAWLDAGAVWVAAGSPNRINREALAAWASAVAEGGSDRAASPDRMPYTKIDPGAAPPCRAYPDDAGLDLTATAPTRVEPGGRALIPTGLAFALPPGTWGLILGRSSTWTKRGLVVMPGVIDAGWRGELFASVYNPGDEPVTVEAGERIAQYIVLPAWSGQPVEVDKLPDHPRGLNGFGSTGV